MTSKQEGYLNGYHNDCNNCLRT